LAISYLPYEQNNAASQRNKFAMKFSNYLRSLQASAPSSIEPKAALAEPYFSALATALLPWDTEPIEQNLNSNCSALRRAVVDG
jgi:hypothetical protein